MGVPGCEVRHVWYRGRNGNATPPKDGEMQVRFLLVPQILKL